MPRIPDAELVESRRAMEEYAVDPSPDDATAAMVDANGVPVLRLVPAGNAESGLIVLHLHGGAYRRGSPRVFAAQLARIAKAIDAAGLFAVKYRLAPENPFPAGLEDAVASYRWLLRSFPADRIVVWGDSAGGGLASAVLLRIAEIGLDRPRGAVLISPWADLRVTAASFIENAESDTLFNAATAASAAADYLDGQDGGNPLISPVLGDWTGQPPMLILVSDIEVLRDDALLLAKATADAGVAVHLERFPEPQHMWPMLDFPRTDDSVRAVQIVRDFLTG